VIWSHTTQRVLTLEDVYAIKITDYDAISAAGISRSEVAAELLRVYFKQIFEDGFFHADPHPGNLFITPIAERENGLAWRLTFVDFGMVGMVKEDIREGLREILIALGTKDANRIVHAYQTLGMLLPSADLKMIEKADAAAFERFWGMSMKELRQISHKEMVQFASQFRELMYSMPFQVPNNLLMLVRMVAILSGMCTGLDPEFNIWTQLAPYAQKLVSSELGENWKIWLEKILDVLKDLIGLPSQTRRVLSLLESGEMELKTPQLDQHVANLERAVGRVNGSLVFAALLIGGVLLINGDKEVYGGIMVAAACIALLLSLLIPGRRR
jgi:predicted unusual protein kinase regulating ubiquinone biosynthesis (AarF/ABC1/UbiB family)